MKSAMWIVLCAALLLGLLAAGSFWLIRNPAAQPRQLVDAESPEIARLKAHVWHLASIEPSRNSFNMASLNAAADYIRDEFRETGCPVSEQTFQIKGETFRNISCFFGPEAAPRLIMGAHYDVHYNDNPGADDNASGVAGILEIARMMAQHRPKLEHRLELVGYTLEEQPHFRDGPMGSHQHARKLVADKVPVKLMISVEMIGYFRDDPGTQSFPLAPLGWVYPHQGNFIGVVGELFERGKVRRAKTLMQSAAQIPVYSLNAPVFIPEAGFSDHRSFWEFGLPAVMVTDTAFLRNPNYHQPTDLPATLDYARMAEVVKGLYQIAVRF